MKQYRVHVYCDWDDWVEAESEDEAIAQIYDSLSMIVEDVYVEDCEDE